MSLIEHHNRIPLFLCYGSLVLAHATRPNLVHAHNIHLTGGEMTINSTHVVIHLNVSAEDWLHWYEIRPDENGQIAGSTLTDAAQRHVQFLEEVLVLRDSAGKRMAFRCRSAVPHWSRTDSYLARDARNFFTEYECNTELAEPGSLFVLQLQPSAFPVDVLWQVVLSVHSDPLVSESVVRLTSRGNAELIDLSPTEAITPESASCESRGRARFQEICAQLSANGGNFEINLSIPLPLLSTWLSVPADSDGFLNKEHHDSILKQAEELIQKNIQISAGSPIELKINSIELLPFNADRSRSEKLTLWTTRLGARLQYNLAGAQDVELNWGLFNAAVLSAHLIHCTDSHCRELVVTTYDPTISLADLTAKFDAPPKKQ